MYLVTAIVACLLGTSAASKMAPRDRWIGWTAAQRAVNLRFVVNNGRFLILPWGGWQLRANPARAAAFLRESD
jgi:hypothetical protein